MSAPASVAIEQRLGKLEAGLGRVQDLIDAVAEDDRDRVNLLGSEVRRLQEQVDALAADVGVVW